MIRFIRAYTTQSIPPERFEKDQEVSRSSDSEDYFVRLGVAGYLVDGKLLNVDHQPLTVVEPVMAVAVDRRFAGGGRGGEVLGLDAPQRASTGPGNEVAFATAGAMPVAGTPEVVLRAQVEQAGTERDDAVRALSEQAGGHQQEIGGLRAELTRVQDSLAAALADKQKASDALNAALADKQKATDALTGAQADAADLRKQLDAATARVTALEAAAAGTGSEQDASKPGKSK